MPVPRGSAGHRNTAAYDALLIAVTFGIQAATKTVAIATTPPAVSMAASKPSANTAASASN
jgi:hypothetical protein